MFVFYRKLLFNPKAVNFEPSEEQRLVAKTAHDFATRVLAPRAAARDREGTFPDSELREMAGLGLLGATVPARLGGAEVGTVAWTLALSELARADASVAVIAAVTNMVAEIVARFAVPSVAEATLGALCAGTLGPASFALSEAQAGSDPAALRTEVVAVDDAGTFRLRGSKMWITSGDKAGVIVVVARDPALGPRAFSTFLLTPGQKGLPGLSVGRREEKMGLRGSSTVSLHLDDVHVPATQLLGKRGEGLHVAFSALDGGRIGIGAQAVGLAQAALGAAVRYARTRAQFGAALGTFPGIQQLVGEDAVRLEAARALVLDAAWRREKGLPCSRQAAQAKLFATEKAVEICDHAIQIHGGYGYTREHPVERFFRDCRVTTIYEGTSEIQRLVISRALLREAGAQSTLVRP